MPCLLILIALAIPRITLVLMWIAGYTSTAFQTMHWPLLGFFFMPYTTCAYAIGMNANGGFHDWSLVLLVIGVMLDLGSHGGTARQRRVRVIEV